MPRNALKAAMQEKHNVTIRFSAEEWQQITGLESNLAIQGLKHAVVVHWLAMTGLKNVQLEGLAAIPPQPKRKKH